MALELSDQKMKLALVGGGLALFLFFNTNFYMPAILNIGKLSRELKNLKTESSKTGESLKILSKIRNMDNKIKEADSSYQKYIPNEKYVAQLITFLSETAEKYNINLLSIDPGDAISQETKVTDSDIKVEYWVIPVKVAIKTTPKELADYLNEIATQERLLSLKSIALERKDEKSEGYYVQISFDAYAIDKITLPEEDLMTDMRFREAEINRILKTSGISSGAHFSRKDFELFKMIDLEQPASAKNSGNGLTGIIYSPSKQLAVINGQLCKLGDVIDGKKVVEILENKVTLEDETKKYSLEMGGK